MKRVARRSPANSEPPLIAHIIHQLGVGGLENGLVNLINRMPPERYRHHIICLEGYTAYKDRITRQDVVVHALNKREGKDLGVYYRLWRLLRTIRPDIVHTRNLATLECQLPAYLAGGAHRVHGEHGWDVADIEGKNKKRRMLRRAYRPFVQRYIAVSAHIEDYLRQQIKVDGSRITKIYNGVDPDWFRPTGKDDESRFPTGFGKDDKIVIGTVGRMQAVKAQEDLVEAFSILLKQAPRRRQSLRLVVVGDGPARPRMEETIRAKGLRDIVWVAGTRDDIAMILKGLDIFVLPSVAEGISNTILEAMATGLAVIATSVGGNPELVVCGETGWLVPPKNPHALAEAIERYLNDPTTMKKHGYAGCERARKRFGLNTMVDGYLAVYDSLMEKNPNSPYRNRVSVQGT